LSIQPHRGIAIIGGNGAGKTAPLRALHGRPALDGGSIDGAESAHVGHVASLVLPPTPPDRLIDHRRSASGSSSMAYGS
jgi:ATPase subunit of ABC transporter with duplicated ATPase domains